MKILNCFLDNRFGGPQNRAYLVAENLKKNNIETIFLFNEKLKNNIPVKNYKSFLLKNLQCIARYKPFTSFFLFFLYFYSNLSRIRKIIRNEDIDIVHANGLLNILPLWAAKTTKARTLWHLNDTMSPLFIRKIFILIGACFSDKIVVAAQKVNEHCFDRSDKLKKEVTVLYAPVDIDKFNPGVVNIKVKSRLKAEFGISDNDIVVGTVGNINMSKGYEYFIKAAKLVKEKKNNTKFLVVGKILETKREYYQRLKKLVSLLNLTKDIIFLGFREDTPHIFSLFNVFVLSSVDEACPVAVLEAMAMKVPIVATNVGGVEEQIVNNESGIIVEPKRADLLAKGILRFLDSPEKKLKKMTEKARERVEKIFSEEIISERHKQIYQELLLN